MFDLQKSCERRHGVHIHGERSMNVVWGARSAPFRRVSLRAYRVSF